MAYLTSAALGLITRFSSDVRGAGGKLVLSGMNSDIRKIFSLTKLDTVIEIHDSLEAAKLALEAWSAEPR